MTGFRQFACRVTTFIALTVLVLCAPTTSAQNVLGNISGTVTDARVALPLPNATVTLLNTDRNEVIRKVSTTGSGYCTATTLPLGGYKVTVGSSGFGDQVFSGMLSMSTTP